MNATEARKLTEASRTSTDINPLLEHVHNKIAIAARQGSTGIIKPFAGIRTPVTAEQLRRVWAALIAEGYTVERVQRSGLPDTTVVSWT